MNHEIVKQPRVLPPPLAYRLSKRCIDIGICLMILPIVIPVMLVCALAIYLNSPGPILFVQERIGKGGRLFRIYKFRTMQKDLDDSRGRAFMRTYVRAEPGKTQSGEKVYKPIGPHEVFRVGRFLRKTSLDELPQIINVLRGEMSIVGPRPNVTWEVEVYYPWHHERLEVKPGITGLAQVRGRSGIDFASLVRYDIEYIEKQSLALDMYILWQTLWVAIQGKGAM